jgi:hypothetical protein
MIWVTLPARRRPRRHSVRGPRHGSRRRCRPKAAGRRGQHFGQAVAEEDVVAQHHRRGRARQEIAGQEIGLRQTLGPGLDDPGEADPPLAAVAQQALELRLVVGGGDDRDLADARQHQDRDRVVDHRLVVDRQKLLRHAQRDRPEARAGAPGEEMPLRVIAPTPSRSRQPLAPVGAGMPNAAVNALQSRREFSGRRAGVGYSVVGMSLIRQASPPRP